MTTLSSLDALPIIERLQDGLGYRVLSEQDIRDLVAQIVYIEDWQFIHTLVTRYYGTGAATIQIVTGEAYNDEGEKYTDIEDIFILNADGKAAIPSGELPWFLELEQEGQDWVKGDIAKARAEGPEAVRALIERWAYGQVCNEDGESDKIPMKDATYDLTTKPVLPYQYILGIKPE